MDAKDLTKDLISGALGNCEVCNGEKKEQGFMVVEPGTRPFWVCPKCFNAYHSLKKKSERTALPMPSGRNLQKAILLRLEYLAAVALGKEANALWDKGQREEALQMFLEVMSVCRDQNEVRDYSATLGNVGVLYTDLGRYEEALKSHKEEETICRELGLDADLGVCLYNQGRLYERMGKLPDARESAKRAVELLRRTSECADTLAKAKSMVARLT
jgi:tetratricopeptide (TPR) repeat protein